MTEKYVFHSPKRFSKAQAAIEYLMTYGWMLLAVSIIGGASFQQLGFQCVPSVTGYEGETVRVEDFATTSDNELLFKINNEGRENVDLQSAQVTGDLGAVWTSGGSSFIIEPGNESNIVTGQEGFQTSEQECSEFNVDITYDTGPLDEVKSSGKIVAPITGEGEIPDAPEDVELSVTATN